MTHKKLICLAIAIMMVIASLSACGGSSSNDTTTTDKAATTDSAKTDDKAATADTTEKDAADTDTTTDSAPAAAPEGAPAEGKDTNNGRPYNLTPYKYDTRADKYLNGINASILPITEEVTTISMWQSFNSRIMKGLDECEVYKEMEKRTNIKIDFVYPPVGSENDNYTLRVNSGDLPDIFAFPPGYPGGPAKAIEDEVYAEITPYYQKGNMPNLKYLLEQAPFAEELSRDFYNDSKQLLGFKMIDIVPSHPWSGSWVRQDLLDQLGMQAPKTIDDWDAMLRGMKDLLGTFPLVIRHDMINYNYQFAGSYEAGKRAYLNKDGKMVYGSIEPGYKDFLTLMNKWYNDGLLDPDFATRTWEDYMALVASGKVGAFMYNYGEIGQAILTGKSNVPDYKVIPVLQPTSYAGQEIHLHQNNARVRSDTWYMTTKAVDDGKDDVITKYMDYWYSQDGGDLCSYGPEGVSYEWQADGTFKFTYPKLTEDADADFWTIMPMFKLHTGPYLRDSTSYENVQEVWDCIDLWATQDASWLRPDSIAFTAEEARELADIDQNVNTYVDEMTLKFITGQEPISGFDAYVENIKKLNIDRAVEINQAAMDRYNAR